MHRSTSRPTNTPQERTSDPARYQRRFGQHATRSGLRSRRLARSPPCVLALPGAIVVDEITYGIELLPDGRRKQRLRKAFAGIVEGFAGRLLAFDQTAAVASARFRAVRRGMGMPMSLADAQIAGTAKSNGFRLATLDIDDFRGIDLETVVPR